MPKRKTRRNAEENKENAPQTEPTKGLTEVMAENPPCGGLMEEQESSKVPLPEGEKLESTEADPKAPLPEEEKLESAPGSTLKTENEGKEGGEDEKKDETVESEELEEQGIPENMRKEAAMLRLQMHEERKKEAEEAAKFFAAQKKGEIREKIQWLLDKSAQFCNSMKEAIENQPDVEKVVLERAVEAESSNAAEGTSSKKKGNGKDKGKNDKAKKAVEEEAKAEAERLPCYFTGGTLRNYQLDGLSWLKSMHTNGLSGILADEMGLGKTIQAIAMICHLYEYGSCVSGIEGNGPILVIAPLSTLHNWSNEFAKFAPKIPVVLYHGTKDVRAVLINKIAKKFTIDDEKHFPVILTSYEIIMKDKSQLQRWSYPYILIDEGHRIKNFNCKLVRDLKTLTQMKGNFMLQSRLLLTGTPLQNNISELWSLLHFLLPNLFDNFDWFEQFFDLTIEKGASMDEQILKKEEEEQVISKLHKILKPILLRRLKSDVELGIPPKKEIVVYAPLTQEQKDMYQVCLNRSIEKLQASKKPEQLEELPAKRRRRTVNYEQTEDEDLVGKDGEEYEIDLVEKHDFYGEISSAADKLGKQGPKLGFVDQMRTVRNALMFLRKITMSPYLVNMLEDEEGFYIPEDETLIENSGKMKLLDQLLTALHERGHKVLVFSQMTEMMNILGHYCSLRDYKYCRLDGSTSLEDRHEQMNQFNTDKDTFLFLLSTRAGGLGINLIGADTVIFFDSDWNPQMDLQAQDRCHRIGQTKPVLIYRLVTRGTIDEQMLNRATSKRALEKVVIHERLYKFQNQEKDESVFKMSTPELIRLLRSTDFSHVLEAGESAIPEKELLALLDRKQVANTEANLKKKGKGQQSFKVVTPSKDE